MALNMAILNQKLVSGFTQFNSSEFNAAKHIKDCIQGFIQSCQDPAGGTFSAMPKINTIETKLANIFSKKGPLGQAIGAEVAQEIDGVFLTLKTSNQIAIVTNPASLMTDCRKLFGDRPASGASFGRGLAKAIVDYTSQITITAMIPGSPPVRVTGPPA